MNTYKKLGSLSLYRSGPRYIGEVMRPGAVIVRREDRVVSAMARLRASGASHAAVVNGHEVEGVIAQHDLEALKWMLRGSASPWIGELQVEDVMQTPPVLLPLDATVTQAGRLLHEGSRECVVVMSEGHAVGIVTEEDLQVPPLDPQAARLPVPPQETATGGVRR